MQKKTVMINPNKLSEKEKEFLQNTSYEKLQEKEVIDKKTKYKNITITMPEELLEKVDSYLRANTAEGRRSGLIARLLGYYLKNQENV